MTSLLATPVRANSTLMVGITEVSPDSITEIPAVSCRAQLCEAVGDYTDTANSSEPIADTLIGTSWSLNTIPLPQGVTGGLLNGVSCPSSCTAVGEGDEGSNYVPLVSTSDAIGPPSLDSISPSSGPSGTHVTVHGSEFTNDAKVYFGDQPAENVQVIDSSDIIAVAPSAPPGPVELKVTTEAGSSTTAYSFTPTCSRAAGSQLPSASGIAAVSIAGCKGYFITDSTGQVSAFGSATWHGDLSHVRLNAPIIAIAATPDGGGYWLLGTDGGVFSFGDATFHGSTGNLRLNAPVVGMAVTPDNRGYWIIAKDGGVFSFGDAVFHGSTGNIKLARPVDGIAVAPGGGGYWLVASDGGVFTFTRDGFFGSLGNITLAKPIVGMSSTPDGRGYTLVGADGGVFTFGDAPFYGSLGSNPPAAPIVDLSPVPADNGYYLVDRAGRVYPFGPGAQYLGSA